MIIKQNKQKLHKAQCINEDQVNDSGTLFFPVISGVIIMSYLYT